MSVFAGHDISLNKYHYVFYSFSKSEPNTLKAQFYDSGQNLLGTQNISFSQRDIPAMLTFLENSQSNPYALGKSPSGFRNMDIAFSGIYKKTLKDSQQQSLMTYINKTFKNLYSNAVTVYDVKVNGFMKYMIDDVEQPNLLALQTGIYVFDQSDSSNSGHLLKFREMMITSTSNNEIDLSGLTTSSSYDYVSSNSYDHSRAFGEYTHETYQWYDSKSSWSSYNSPSTHYTNVDGVNISGDWLQIDLINQYKVGSFHIVRINEWESTGQGQLKEFYVVGSNDGNLFTTLGHYYGANISALNANPDFTSSDLVIPHYYSHIDNNTLETNSILERTSDIISITNPESFRYLRFVMYDVNINAAITNIRLFEIITNEYTTNVTHEGTPGTPNSYSIIDVTQATPDLQYYCENHTGSMYGEFKTLTDLTSYRVRVETNVLGDPVFALSPPGTNEYYNQIDVSFGAGSKFLFDVSDPTMADISFVFGTVVDNSSTIIDSFVTYQDGVVILDICSGYVGESLKYFEDTSAGMGYKETIVYTVISTQEELLDPPRTHSSTYGSTYLGYLGSGNVWFPVSGINRYEPYPALWMLFDLGTVKTVSGILQRLSSADRTEAFKIQYSLDGSNYVEIDQYTHNHTYTYNGNEISNDYFEGIVTAPSSYPYDQSHNFVSPITARYVKFFPYENVSAYHAGIEQSGIGGGWASGGRFGVIVQNEIMGEKDPYIVTVSGDTPVFYIDGSANPNLTFTPGDTYVFDLSHNSNASNTFVLGTVPDSSTNLIDYQTIVGTPGQPGAYTSFTASGETVYYYSFETPEMGYKPPTYTVKTDTNVLGDTVFSIQKPDENVFYTQPDLSFGAGFVALFDVADIDESYNLVFGTEVDVSSTIQTQYFSQMGDVIVLSIPSDYSGNSLKYFEDTTAGMGYEQLTNNVLASDFTNTSVLDKWFTTASDADSIFTLSGETTYSFANGDYSLYASAAHSSILPHYVLDPSSVDNPTGSGTSDYDWHMYADFYSETGETIDSITLNKAPNNLSNGVTTASDGNIYSGYYLELTMPYYLFIKKIQIIGRVISAMPQNTPRKVYLCGSNDNGTTYHFITEVNFAKQAELQTISVSDVTTAYKNVRFIVNEIEGHINLEYWALIGDVLKTETYVSLVKYIVTVSNNVFYIDGSANPNLTFTSDTTYVFDLSHNSNAGNTLVLGILPDSSTNLIDYQTVVGTPGQPGAYTSFTASGETVYYYSFETPNMGYKPPTYIVKTDTNVLGDTVFSIQKLDENVFYTQPDLSFGAGFVAFFDVAYIGSYNLVFGTEVDVSSTIQTQYFSQTGGTIILSIPSDYSGNSLKYFEDTTAGMGYVDKPEVLEITGSTLLSSDYSTGSGAFNASTFSTPSSYMANLVSTSEIIPDDGVVTIGDNHSYSVDTFDISGYASSFVNGSYEISITNDRKYSRPYCILNTLHTTGTTWISRSGFLLVGGNYTSPYTNTTTIDGNVYSGTWFQKTTPYAFKIKSIKMYGRTSMNWEAIPDNVHMLGSNDGGLTFEHIITKLGVGNSNKNQWPYTVTFENVVNSYKTIRMIVSKLVNSTGVSNPSSNQMQLSYVEFIGDVMELTYGQKPSIAVEVSNNVFYIDGSANPQLTFIPDTTYVFDQSDPTNAGNTLVLSNVPDSSTNLIDYQTIVGTPGQPGAYTSFTASGETVYYYSFESPNMGYEPPTYIVQTDTNMLGDTVFSIQKPGESVYYAQPDLSFGAGFVGQFDVTDIGSYSLVFGTEVDVSSTIQTQYFSQTGGTIILSIPSYYSGNSLKYFENTTAGMGYKREQLQVYGPETNLEAHVNHTSQIQGSTMYNLATSQYDITDVSGVSVVTLGGKECLWNKWKMRLPVVDHNQQFSFSVKIYFNSSHPNPDFPRIFQANLIEHTTAPDMYGPSMSTSRKSFTPPGGTVIDLSYDVWYLFTMTIDAASSTTTFKTYIDNNAPQTSTGTSATWSEDFMHIGYPHDNRYSHRYLNDFKFYNRILSDADVLALYNTGTTGTISYVNYTNSVTVSGDTAVFYIDNSPIPNFTFTPNTTYIFDQSDPTNAGNTFVIGTVPDSSTNLIDYQTIVGTPGQPGAYTSFTASGETVFYYSFESAFMGYQTSYTIVSVSKESFYPGETTTIRVKNTTPYDGAYTITLTDINQSDLNNVDLSGSIPKRAITDFTYSIPSDVTNVGSFTYSIDGTDLSATIQITEAPPVKIYTVDVSGDVYWLQQKDNIGPLGSNYQQPSLPQFESGFQYEFHYTDNNHPIRLSTTIDGTHGGGTEYTTGVTFDTASTPKKLIFIAEEDINLHYYCQYHDSYGDTATSTVYKTYLENRTLYAKFDVGDMSDLQGTHTGAHNIITNHGSAGDNAIIQLIRFTNGTNYSPDVSLNSTEYKVGNASLYNPYPYGDAIGANNAPRMSISSNVSTGDKHTGSFMVWIKRLDNSNLFINGTPSNNKNVFFTTYDHDTGYRITIKFNDSNQYYIQMNDDDDLIFLTDNAVAGQTQDSNYNFGTDITQWNHLAFTSKSISNTQYTITIYLNGSSGGSKTFDKSGYDYFQTGNWSLIHENNYYYFQGYIDDLRFYDQWMTDSEINAVYNGTL